MLFSDLVVKRKKYNISQTKLAECTGFSKAAISSWELKKTIPTDEEIETVSLALSRIISDIETDVFDIRKKRITHSAKEKIPLPPVIKTLDDYTARMNQRHMVTSNAYRDELSLLYEKAQQPKPQNSPNAIALFSGCGGLSLGFAAEGFKLIGHVDIEESANTIYECNFPDSALLGKDICCISDEQISEWINHYGPIDVLIGGPPCQGFSLAGKRDPSDIRNQLYKYYVHMVSRIRPKVFVMENVRLLTSMRTDDGRLFIDCIVESFSKEGYSIIKQEINASDYGVPQSRERVILVGVRKDFGKSFSFPSGEYVDDPQLNLFGDQKTIRTFRDATSDLEMLESGEQSSDPLHWSIVHPSHVINWLKDVPEGCSAHDNPDPHLRPPSGFNTTYKRIMWDEPCSTISTNFSMISGCRNVHPVSTRSLTIREAARAQSFPDEFAFIGKWGDIRKAIGNAVPPLLAVAIAHAIKEQYFM